MNIDLKTFFKRFYQKALFEEDVLSTAAQVAFYFSFALFPLLLFLVSLFGIILESADDFRGELFFYLRQVMPYSAFDLVQTTIREVTENSSGGKLTIGLLVALWSASAGVDSLRVALNSVYSLEEKRSWLKTKFVALVMTFSLTVLVMISVAIVFYGWKLLSLLLDMINLPIPSPIFLMILQWVTVLGVLLIIFGLIYNYLPMHEPFKWVWITPGSITGIILWLVASYAFRTYLSYFNTYDRTYGSLGAVIILLLWLFLTALVILIGGIINATLQEMTDPETAAKSEEKSEMKLEKAKADRPAEEIEKLKEEKREEQKKTAGDESAGERPLGLTVQTAEHRTAAEATSVRAGNFTRPEKSVGPAASYITDPHHAKERTSDNGLVGITVAGAFGFLMGLLFRKKDE